MAVIGKVSVQGILNVVGGCLHVVVPGNGVISFKSVLVSEGWYKRSNLSLLL